MIKFGPYLTPKCLETSETSEMNELYSGYLRFSGAIDSVCDVGINEWE